jgi:hypothetical protein
MKENAIQTLVLSAASERAPSPGATATTGEHVTWDGADDETRTEVDEDPYQEEEKPRKNTSSRHGVAPFANITTSATHLALMNSTTSSLQCTCTSRTSTPRRALARGAAESSSI